MKMDVFEEMLTKHKIDNSYVLTSKLNQKRYLSQIKECSKLFPKNAKILDMGCGLGYTATLLAMARPDLKITGVDMTKHDCWQRFSQEFDIKFLQRDALATDLKIHSFDGIMSFGVIEHVGNGREHYYLLEAKSLLKEDGLLYLCNLPNKYSVNEFFSRLMRVGGHDNTYCEGYVKRLFSQAGFSIKVFRRDFLIPSQVNRVSKFINSLFNKHHVFIYRLDRWLTKTFIGFFSQTYTVVAVNKSQ
jgi:cyclopropane fatty-acyl-phospholipid synthase-like methyltransferase